MSSSLEIAPAADPSKHIPALDGLRAIAILMVMVFHFTPALPATDRFSSILYPIIRVGWAGVDLFFVLSGYLITDILLRTRRTPHYALNFYARRALRIFPLYYAVLVVTLLIIPTTFPTHIDGRREGKVIASGAWLWFYGTNLIQARTGELVFSRGWLNLAHFWSLAVEEHFYLVWPALVAWLSRRQMIAVCIAFILIAVACRPYVAPPPDAPRGANYLAAYVLTPCRMDALAIGGLVALLVSRDKGTHPLRHAGPAACVFAAVPLAYHFHSTGRLYYTDHFIQTFGYTLIAIFFAGLLIVALRAKSASPLAFALGNPVARQIAKYSYGMYVFHLLLEPWFRSIIPLAKLQQSIGLLPGSAIYVLACITLTFIVAAASWYGFEQWFLRLKKHFHSRKTPSITA